MGKNRSSLKHFDFIIIDLLCLSLSFLIAYLIKLNDGVRAFNTLYLTIYFWMMLTTVVYCVFFNPFKNVLRRDALGELKCSFMIVLANAVSIFSVLYAFKAGQMYSRSQFAYTFIIYSVISFLSRTIWKKKLIDSKSANKINVFVISDVQSIRSVIFNIENSEFSEYLIKGIYLVDADESKKIGEYAVYTKKDEMYQAIKDNSVFEVIAYCEPSNINKDVLHKLLEDGIQFHISIDRIFGLEPDREEISKFSMYRTLNFNPFSFSARQILYDPFKRFFDIVFSFLACIFLIPIYLVIKICYVLDGDKGPILYTQTRVGKNNKEFKLYKFRSMVPDADEALEDLLKEERYKTEWEENHKFDDDPRITKVGRIIRKTSIDEFPQFLNVLRGEMSIIGPRPLVPGELKEKNGLILYEKVRPGITGWWACNGRSNISYEERLELEYYYVKNYSLSLDVMCILKTIYVVLFRKGAK